METSTSPPIPSQTDRKADTANRYFVCPIFKEEPEAWIPSTRNEVLEHKPLEYFGGIFEVLERLLGPQGLTFYLTWRVDVLPRYGPDVVAVVMGDEWGRYPLYTNRVRAVFKMMGNDFPLEAHPLRTPLQLTAVTALKYARTQFCRLPYLAQAWRDRSQGPGWTGGTPVPSYDIPIGYVSQDALPIKPLEERSYDLFFSGSLANADYPWYTPQSLVRTPKDVSRERLVRAMRQLQADRPDLNILVDVRDSYVPTHQQKTQEVPEWSYSDRMMNTRICPVPRGTRLETGRLYEALRYGCIPVTEPLPDRWFLNGLPRIEVDDWADMPALVRDLLAQPEHMQALHEAALDWWATKCSEEAIGTFMAEMLAAALTPDGST
jgi:hypothetical protein